MSGAWHARWMATAEHFATFSKDRSTQVGAVIVDGREVLISQGWNGFPRGINDSIDERHERPAKYQWTEHAERNAIYNAAAIGSGLLGCSLYSTLFPCTDCARGIIQVGIKRVISPIPDWVHPRWGSEFAVTREMFEEAGVSVWFV